MPQECTATAIIWPRHPRIAEARYELWENFRPVWRSNDSRPESSLVSGLEFPLATVLALHLAREARLDEVPTLNTPSTSKTPIVVSNTHANQLYRLFRGRSISIVRYHGSLVCDRELPCLDRAGVSVDLLTSEWLPAGGGW
jgi:hypothetical protein